MMKVTTAMDGNSVYEKRRTWPVREINAVTGKPEGGHSQGQIQIPERTFELMYSHADSVRVLSLS